MERQKSPKYSSGVVKMQNCDVTIIFLIIIGYISKCQEPGWNFQT